MRASLLFLLIPTVTWAQSPSPGPLAPVVQPYVDRHTLPGAVLLAADKNKILDLEAVGYADVATQKPMRPDAVFAIASMSKAMCATALMMLVDEGKVGLDDPVEKYLPEFKGQMMIAEKDADHLLLRKPSHPILIRNILTHTSGLPYSSAIEKPTLDGLPLEKAVRSYAMTPLLFDPDTQYLYSSAGINTAARIVEVVGGLPYEQFLDQRLLQPLGMKDTTFWPDGEQVARHPSFYRTAPDKLGLEEEPMTGRFTYPLGDHTHRYPIPGSGLFSTAADVAKFCQMFLNGGVYGGKTYISAASFQKMTTRQTGPGLKESYGLGWQIEDDGYSHGGSYHTFMHVYPRQGLITILLTQVEPDWPKVDDEINPAFQKAALEKFSKP